MRLLFSINFVIKSRITFIRHFETTGPNQKWTTDVSEFKHKDGKLYLLPIMDMYDGSIIAFDISEHPDFNQAKRMIDSTFKQYDNLEGLSTQLYYMLIGILFNNYTNIINNIKSFHFYFAK